MKNSIFLSLAAFGLLGCTEPNPAFNPDPLLPGECRAGNRAEQSFDAYERPEKLDVLIVVDSSGDVERMQDKFAQAAQPWLEDLKARGLDVWAAVTTTDLDGRPLAPAGDSADGCTGNTTQVVKSSSPNWARILACNVAQGSSGDPFQQSLQKIRTVLESDIAGDTFIREDARLLILVLSNEDDCSHGGMLTNAGSAREECYGAREGLLDLEEFAQTFRDAKSTPEGVAFVAISGPPSDSETDEIRPVCNASVGSAYGANRLSDLSILMGDQGFFTSVCVEDFGPTLNTVTERLGIAKTLSLCSERPMAHEPLAVSAVDEDEELTPIRLGAAGFVYLGATDECENGLLEFQTSALVGAGARRIDVEYCVE